MKIRIQRTRWFRCAEIQQMKAAANAPSFLIKRLGKRNIPLPIPIYYSASLSSVSSSVMSSNTKRKRISTNNCNEQDEEQQERIIANRPSEKSTTTSKAGWCLRQGLEHIAALDDEIAKRIYHHGAPTFYSCLSSSTQQCRHEATQDLKDPQTCFESLCRIIAGQFVSGKSAQAAWKRLLALKPPDGDDKFLTPETILRLTGGGGGDGITDNNSKAKTSSVVVSSCSASSSSSSSSLEEFQKAAGLTKAKARSIQDLAQHFVNGRLSEEFLTNPNNSNSPDMLRQALLKVRGIGPWSCDMFLMFYLEHANILPLGDLGVRKGIAKHFFPSQNKKNKDLLCPKKDARRIQKRLQDFSPYHSLLSYYMWRVADTELPKPPPAVDAAPPAMDATAVVASVLQSPLLGETDATSSSTDTTTTKEREDSKPAAAAAAKASFSDARSTTAVETTTRDGDDDKNAASAVATPPVTPPSSRQRSSKRRMAQQQHFQRVVTPP